MNTTPTNALATIDLANLSRVTGGATERNDHEKKDLQDAANRGHQNGSNAGTDFGRNVRKVGTDALNFAAEKANEVKGAWDGFWGGVFGG